MSTSLLLDEAPLQVLPSLAEAIGLEQAIVLQQIHFLTSNPKNGVVIKGHRYVWNTYEGWQAKYFPWWTVRTIRRIFRALEKRDVLIALQPDGRMSRKKYYRVSAGAAVHLTYERLKERKDEQAKLAASEGSKLAASLTESTTERTQYRVQMGFGLPCTLEDLQASCLKAAEDLGIPESLALEHGSRFWEQHLGPGKPYPFKAGWRRILTGRLAKIHEDRCSA
jgi:hypothetical protein